MICFMSYSIIDSISILFILTNTPEQASKENIRDVYLCMKSNSKIIIDLCGNSCQTKRYSRISKQKLVLHKEIKQCLQLPLLTETTMYI